MDYFEQKDAQMRQAFSHLVQDSSDEEIDEEDGEPTSSINDADDQKPVVLDGDAKDQPSETVVGISMTDEDDVQIVADDNDDIQFIGSHTPNQLKTRRGTYRRDSAATGLTPSTPIMTTPKSNPSRFSIEEEEFNLKLMISGRFTSIETTYNTKLGVALKSLILDLERRGRMIVITGSDDQPISLDETPKSLSLESGSLLNAIEAKIPTPFCATKPTVVEEVINPDMLKLKLQDGHRKHVKEYTINKCDPVLKLKELWSKEYDLDVASIRLCFDGDMLSDEATPEDSDIEDGCVIDVMITQPK